MRRKDRAVSLAGVLHTVDVASQLPITFLTAAAMQAGADEATAARIAREVFNRHLTEAPSVESARQLLREITDAVEVLAAT